MDSEQVILHLTTNRKKFVETTEFSSQPGIYAFFYNGGALPYISELIPDNEIIYIGKTESSQKKRSAQTHFKSGKTGSSTVRRSFGSLLKEKMSLIPIPRNETDFIRGRLSHFKFDENSEYKLTDWMKLNLSISFFEFPKSKQEIEGLESEIIYQLTPKLNIDKNPNNQFKSTLQMLRKQCSNEAHSSQPIKPKNIEKEHIIDTFYSAPGSKGKYTNIWQNTISAISDMLNSENPNGCIELNSRDFAKVGNRKNYSFNIEYDGGSVSNNLSGSAVARDLAAVISRSNSVKAVLKNGHYKIRMDKNFALWVSKLG
jgi:hypothetical protein|tara:strand:+ start:266 stop:1207 length:942 start_codon:yes stop_codon:yes gene_type:complete